MAKDFVYYNEYEISTLDTLRGTVVSVNKQHARVVVKLPEVGKVIEGIVYVGAKIGSELHVSIVKQFKETGAFLFRCESTLYDADRMEPAPDEYFGMSLGQVA